MFVTRALAAEEPIEGAIILARENEHILRAHGTTLRDAQGKALGVLVVMHNATRLHRLENARRDFIANVSHELKTLSRPSKAL